VSTTGIRAGGELYQIPLVPAMKGYEDFINTWLYLGGPRFLVDVGPASTVDALFNSLEQLGVEEAHGERGYSTLERRWARPSLDINGLTSGYQKEGSKTIVPSTATAKFSFRLVPNQDPAKIGFALRTHLAENCLPGVKMELVEHHTSSAVLADTGSDYITAAVAAIEKGFGKSPVLIREGGSVPIVAEMAQTLDAGVLMLGWGLPDDNTHSPNEKFCLADYHRAIKASAALYRELGKLQK